MNRKIIVMGAALVLAAGVAARADDQPTLDSLLNLKPATPANPTDHATPTVPVPVVGPAGESPEAVFNRAIIQMKQASDNLGTRLDPGMGTQRLEKTVLSLMDTVISEAEKQEQKSSSQSQGGSKPKPGDQQQSGSQKNADEQQQPGQASGTKPGGKPGEQINGKNGGGITPGGVAPDAQLNPIDQNKVGWGKLPDRLRAALLEGGNEKKSNIYMDLTNEFYKRLGDTEH